MTLETTRAPWTLQAEAAIRALRDVEGVSVQTEGDEIREVHVLTRSSRPPKQIVRDVQTVLLATFNRSIDYRVVSVAYAKPSGETAESATGGRVSDSQAETRRDPRHADRPEPGAAERVRYTGVNLFVAGPRTQAQVELRWKGLARMGNASGWSTRDSAHRLVAEATLVAVQEFLEGDVVFGIEHVELLRAGRQRVVMVAVTLLAHRQEKILIGSCTIERDVQQAVVLATLAAINRIIGGLPAREPTEYVLRPASN